MTCCRTVARLMVAVVALASVLAADPASAAPPAGAGATGILPVTLQVAPAGQSALGTELTLTVTLGAGDMTWPGGGLVLVDGDDQIAELSGDIPGVTTTTYTPSEPGVHQLQAIFHPAPFTVIVESNVVEHTVIDPMTVLPRVSIDSGAVGDRAPAGTPVGISAYIGDPWSRDVTGGQVVFLDGGVPVATAPVVLDVDLLVASASFTPTQGVHELSARFLGAPGVPPATSRTLLFSGLPQTCPDQARPGSGALVRLAYLVVLDRCPDAAGFAYWTGRLDGGTSAAVLGRGLALSAEGIDVTIDAAYRQVLDRRADAAGRAVWAAKLRAGWTTSQLLAALTVSPEFVFGTRGHLLDHAFERLVGRPLDEASRPYWADRLRSAPWSGSFRAMALTPEALGRVVDGVHRAALGVAASPTTQVEIQRGIKSRRGDWRHVAGDLLGLAPALDHAQTYPDPT